jgi:predicted porin
MTFIAAISQETSMKKFGTALTLLALSTSAAWAQSNVTLYGIVDVGANYTTGLKGGSLKQLVSGIMDGSRLGVRGTEDLGGGYRALFALESRVEADSGTTGNRAPSGSQLPDRLSQATLLGLPAQLQPIVSSVANQLGATVGVNLDPGSRFWDRQAYVGLVTPVGAVLAGRQYTPAYQVNAEFDVMQTQSSLSAGQVAALPSTVDIRQSNAVQYRIELNGITAGAMVAAGEGSSTTGRFMGLMGMYKTDAFSVGLGYNTRKNELGQKSLTTTIFGASAALGPGKLSGFVANVKDSNPSGLSAIGSLLRANPQTAPVATPVLNAFLNGFKLDASLMHIGYKMSMGANTFYTAFSRFNDKTKFNADTDSYGVAYTYAFSKRTDLNVVLTHFNNKGLGQASPGQAGFLGGVTAQAGKDANNMAVGVRHRF